MKFLLSVLLVVTTTAFADPALLVALPDDATELPPWLLEHEQHQIVQRDGAAYLTIAPPPDAYTPTTWQIRLDNIVWPEATQHGLLLTWFDEGAAPITAELHATTADIRAPRIEKSIGYTRLNTGAVRTTLLVLHRDDNPPAALELQLTGMQYLKKIETVAVTPELINSQIAAVPISVKPMFTLDRPMELVTTAGVDVRGGFATLDGSLQAMHEFAPLAKVLGFTSIESYVSWKRLEPNAEGEFDFSFYDAITEKLKQYDLKWFPLLIVGSGYALPDWFRESEENIGFQCLEHGLENDIQSIWSPTHERHVERVLKAFGEHYEPTGILEGVRLGPSGNYGESQYPAGGNWGPKDQPMHIHIGWWAGDPHALQDYRAFLQDRYQTIEALNTAWEAEYTAFDAIEMILPEYMRSRRQRVDFTDWYTDSMSEWCEYWAVVARDAMPNTVIHQSAGGWGFREAGTDYTAQAKSMMKVDGGIRLTNETDSYEQNFYATRLAATAARLYGIPLGYEPASSHTARGSVGRVFNTLATNGDHYFTYQSNIMNQPGSIEKWLKYAPTLDWRQDPLVEVAIYYPETYNQLEDSTFRHLYAWGFNPRAAAVRRVVEVDYLDERLIREGYLDRYKTLVFAWGDIIESDVLAIMDAWLRNGGVITYPSFPKGNLTTVEGSAQTFRAWSEGDTGKGRFHRFRGDMEPTSEYAEFVEDTLLAQDNLHPWTRLALQAQHPPQVFFSIQQDGHLLILNYEDEPATITLPNLAPVTIESYGIERMGLPQN